MPPTTTSVHVSWLSTPSTHVIVTYLIALIVLTKLLSCPPVIVLTCCVAIVLTLIVETYCCTYCLASHYCIVTHCPCYILPSTGLVLNVALYHLYSLSRVPCQS
jgi:hypothetical protein